MPTLKARVFSSHPENAASLAEALRQCGYQVEILRPDATPASTADLDIVLEAWDGADVVRRATELAADLDADVVVAPGSLTMASSQSIEAPLQPKIVQELDIESRLKAALPAVHESVVVEGGGRGGGSSQPGDSVPGFWRRAIPAAAVTLSAWTSAAREILVSARDRARERKEQALMKLAQLQAVREEHLLELTHQRIQAEERASKLAAARKNAGVYLEQLQRESSGRIYVSSQDSSAQEAHVGSRQSSWHDTLQTLRERLRFVRWDTALAGLASAGALFAIGLAAASFNTKPALSASEDHAPAVTSTPATTAVPQPSPVAANSRARPVPSAHARSAKPSPGQRKSGRDRTATGSYEQTGANDVVIRHLAQPTPRPTPKVQAQGWKHFSDMDH